MIKNIVISGGGPNGISQLAAIIYFIEKNYLDLKIIQSVYGTSVGAVLGLFIVLQYDFQIIADFFLKRPWHKVINFDFEDMVLMIQNNGYMDMFIVEDIIDRLLGAVDISKDITFKELYDQTNTLYCIYGAKVNTFEPIMFSHETYPSLSVKTALLISCALPPMFKPILYNGEYYMDGGVFCNYPINDCLERFPNKQETLGIQIISNAKLKSFYEDTSMPEYILLCVYKLILQNQNKLKLNDIQELSIEVKFKSLDPIVWRNFIDETIRKEMYDTGTQAAKDYLTAQSLETDQVSPDLA